MTTAEDLPVIASFWYGSDLSWLEALCIKSYLDRGHRFILYTAEPLAGVPDGTETRPAADILWPPPFDISDNDRLRVAVFSDIFRLRMVQSTGFVWVDLDAYCLRPFRFGTPYVFGREGNAIPSGVLGLPPDSPALAEMLGFVTSENPSQPWRGARLRKLNAQRVARGERWGIEDLPWGCSGPKAFGYFLAQSGEDGHAMPVEVFYPLTKAELRRLHDPNVATEDIERDGVHSVHVYGFQRMMIATEYAGLPVPGSYLERLCRRHDVDPHEQRMVALDWMLQKRERMRR